MKNNIERIVYINLDSRQDRREFMEEQLSKIKIPSQRFSAIAPTIKSIVSPVGEYHRFYQRATARLRTYVNREAFFDRGRGVFGCYLSHYLIHKKALEEGWGNFLVLEDDCEIHHDSLDVLNEKINTGEIPPDWDIIRDTWESTEKVGTYEEPDFQSRFYQKPRQRRINQKPGGTHFQLIKAESLERLIHHLDSDYVYNIDSVYCTNMLNIYHSICRGGTISPERNRFGSDIPKTPHSLLRHQKKSQKPQRRENTMKQKFSFACHAFNEEKTIGRYLKSCLQFKDILSEVSIINHRSSDNTAAIIDSFREKYKNSGVRLNVATESRDLSAEFTFADIRHNTMKMCTEEIVFLHDSDFVFGAAYREIIEKSLEILKNEQVYAVRHPWPVMDEGATGTHGAVPRVLKRDKTKYVQVSRFEQPLPVFPHCSLAPTIPTPDGSVLSLNVKTEEQKMLRRTMCTFAADAQAGIVTGSWHEAYEAGNLRTEAPLIDRIHNPNYKPNLKPKYIDLSLYYF